MAHIDAPARGRRREATVNLVPYVDILMTLMAFFVLLAAFHDARASLPVDNSNGACATCGSDGTSAVVEVRASGYRVGLLDGAARRVVDRSALLAELSALRRGGVSALVVEVEDGAALRRIVEAVDAGRAAGLSAPRVVPAPS